MIPRYSLNYSLSQLIRSLLLKRSSSGRSFFEESREQIFTSDGSGAFRILLRSLNLDRGEKVVVPLLTCERVAAAVVSEGLTPVFADVTPAKLMSTPQDYVDACLKSGAKVIVPVSMWGYPVDISEIKNKVPVDVSIIQDCCLSFGSSVSGLADGFHANAAFYSFGSGKPLCLGCGGALSIRKSSNEKLNTVGIDQLGWTARLSRCFKVCIKSIFFNKWLYFIVFNLRKSRPSNEQNFFAQDLHLMPDEFEHLLNQNITMVERSIKEAEKNYSLLCGFLSEHSIDYIKPSDNVKWNYWMFPILLPLHKNVGTIKKRAERAGFEVITPYEQTLAIAKSLWSYSGECPNSEGILDKLILIPSLQILKQNDIQELIKVLS